MKKKKEFNVFDDDIDIISDEEEIVDSYEDEIEKVYDDEDIEPIENSDEELEDDYNYEPEKKPINYKKIINIVFFIIMLCLVMITVDVISVGKFNKGPYFAVKTRTYDDGGTREYYGLGYKVISYNQFQGRRDKEIGFWSLKYNAEPVTVQDVDLAIEFNKDEVATYKKYYKKFVRVVSTLKKIDKKNHKIILEYYDEDCKYTLDIVCNMVEEQYDLSKLVEKEETTIIGTVNKYKFKTNKETGKLYINDCFAEQ